VWQVGFIKFLVQPLFFGVARYLPELKKSGLAHLESNLTHFSRVVSMGV
jgi:hypothetical protein